MGYTDNKKWYQSWTLWVNLALIVLSAFNQIAQLVPIPAEVVAYVAMVGNILLRFKTNNPVTIK